MTIEPSVAEAVRYVRADLELLRQALFNLLQNAVQFSPAGSTIRVTAESDGMGRAVVKVADQGPGVAKDAVESLFTPYFTTRPDGTGLGLAIVRHIATMHDWSTRYHPDPSGGSIFEIGNIHATAKTHDSDC